MENAAKYPNNSAWSDDAKRARTAYGSRLSTNKAKNTVGAKRNK